MKDVFDERLPPPETPVPNSVPRLLRPTKDTSAYRGLPLIKAMLLSAAIFWAGDSLVNKVIGSRVDRLLTDNSHLCGIFKDIRSAEGALINREVSVFDQRENGESPFIVVKSLGGCRAAVLGGMLSLSSKSCADMPTENYIEAMRVKPCNR